MALVMSEQYLTHEDVIAASDRYESYSIEELIDELRWIEQEKPWFNQNVLWHVWTYVESTHPQTANAGG